MPPAAAPATDEASEPAVERDTEASCNTLAVELLPGGTFPTCLDLFQISVRNAALNGWVKQGSPACAAASLAGAFNTVRGLERGAPGAFCQADVIEVMVEQLEEERLAKQASAARLLGVREPAVLDALEREVAFLQLAKGRPLTSRKKDALKPPDLRAAIREVCAAQAARAAATPAAPAAAEGAAAAEAADEAEMWRALDAIYAAADAEKKGSGEAASGGGERPPLGAATTANVPAGGGGGEEGGEEDEASEAGGGGGGSCDGGAVALQKEVHKALVSMLQVHGMLEHAPHARIHIMCIRHGHGLVSMLPVTIGRPKRQADMHPMHAMHVCIHPTHARAWRGHDVHR